MSFIKFHNLRALRTLKEKKETFIKAFKKINKINSEFDASDFYIDKNVNCISKTFDNSSKSFLLIVGIYKECYKTKILFSTSRRLAK